MTTSGSSPAAPTRAAMLEAIRAPGPWDLVVIGGGATGLGAAVDASARGYRTLLIEAHDFAKGTSSRSTKLVHGGVRYLARGEVGLVREALRERARLLANAPHLAWDAPFLVPAYSWLGLGYYGAGLKAYDLLALGHGLGRSRWISRAEALRLAPTIRPEGLRGGVVYRDGQFDDARLAIALARTALDLGGTALNYVEATGLEKASGRVTGVTARDSETGETFRIAAKAVVNATGVYVDGIRAMDDASARPMVRPSRGIHLVLDRSFLPGEAAVLVPKTEDGRVLFAIPWHGRVVLGTTDTPTTGTPIEPRASRDEVAYLLDHAARLLTRAPGESDVLSIFAGLRPLLGQGAEGATAGLSREHAVAVSGSGLVTVTGGKWTTYRRMAADAVDRASAVAGLPPRPCPTADLALHGAAPSGPGGPGSGYGSDAPELERLIASRPGWGQALHPRLPYRRGEVAWAARREMARSVEDVLSRRTRALLLDARASREAAPEVAAILADELGRDDRWRDRQVAEFAELARGYLPPEVEGQGR